jgi:type II secretory pathway component GspD/PulD (secretin)
MAAAVGAALAALPIAAQSPPPPPPAAHRTERRPAVSHPESSQKAREAHQALERGLRAEHANDWEGAFLAYSEAAEKSPNDRAILMRREGARFAVVQQHTRQAEREILRGQENRARADLEAALRVDPGYSVARERLQQLRPESPQVPASTSAKLAGLAHMDAAPGKRDFDFRGTTRGAYEAIARQFGVTAAFDPDLVDRQVGFRVSGVDFATAMRLLSEQTDTFWRTVDAKTFFVADNTPQKRREYAPEVQRTILLPASENTDDMTQTMRLVREIVGIRRSQLDSGTHTLTVRDTPENVALAQALVNQVERPRGELMLDIDILEVDRQAARQLGIAPPEKAQIFSLSSAEINQLTQAANAGTLAQVLQTIFGVQNPLAATQGGLSALVPPLIAFGGGRTIFLATLPGASATFSSALSSVESAQRVLLRIQDGKPATFFVGERFPISLALLSASLATAPTQFTPGILPGAFPRNDFAVGASPAGVATGDFNMDGHADLAVVNLADNTVSILLGSGDGTFAAHTDYATGVGPSAVVVGDFNRDGIPDLAVANQTDGTVSILPGNGDGTFAAHKDIAVGAGPVALVAGDFNADGKTDLAVVNQADNTVSILLGNGDGTFTLKQSAAVGNAPTAITPGDFNNDGKTDLAVANGGANTVSILLGNGDGTFAAHSDFPAGGSPSAVATADFNGDGRLDLAVANRADNTVSIFPGNGDGSFGASTQIATGNGPAAMLTADFNSDNLPDLVVANHDGNTVSVLLGLGNDSLVDAVDLPTGNGPAALATGDLNGDLSPDLVVANESSDTVSAILNETQIPVTPSAPTTAYPASEYVDLGLKVHATPRLHPDGEVTLDLQFDITSLTGQNVNGIPILSNRSIQQSVRLRDNQTSVLTGIFQNSQTRQTTGLPGLSRTGLLGYLTGVRSNQKSNTELVIAITPRQVRLAPRTNSTIYAGWGTGTPAPALPPPPAAPRGRPAGAPPSATSPAQRTLPSPGAPPQPGRPARVTPLPPTADR